MGEKEEKIEELNDIIDEIWKKLNGFNLSTIDSFYIDEKIFKCCFTPTMPPEPTLAWGYFNLNINKVVETLRIALKLDDNNHRYYVMCDNALVLLISAFESYLTSNYNNIRKILGKEEIDPKILTFQRKESLKEKYGELDIEIAQLDENLWREIFSSRESEKGIIKLRNIIVHNGWKGIEKKSDMLNHIDIKELTLTICKFIKIVEETTIKQYPNLKNQKN